MKSRKRRYCLVSLAALVLGLPGAALAQGNSAQRFPEMNFVMGGMGAFNYTAALQGPFEHNFGAKLAPIVLWNMSSDFLFEGHFEFELEDGETQTHLEYAQIDYQGLKNIQVVAGKFLVPFGVFGQRLHPVWINRLPSMPLLYVDAEEVGAMGHLLPVISDIGVMLQAAAPLGSDWDLDLSVYVTQGPRAATGSAEASRSPAGSPLGRVALDLVSPGGVDIPNVAFGTNFEENNKDKMVGGRLGFVGASGLEFHVSGMHAAYDAEDQLAFNGLDVAAWWDHGPYRVRGEGAVLWQQFDTPGGVQTLRSPGYYLQVSRRIGKFEPVLRWSHLLDREVEGTSVMPRVRQISEGIDYWFHPSVVSKIAIEENLDGPDRLLVQWGFGF